MFFLFQREISEIRRPMGAKFCTVVSTISNFIMPMQNFGGLTPKNFRGQKHAKFGPMSDDFEVWRRIYAKRMKIFKIGQIFDRPIAIPPALGKTSQVKFGSVALEISMWNRTHLKPIFWPLKIWEGKKGQNLVRFTTTFESDRKYLWTG